MNIILKIEVSKVFKVIKVLEIVKFSQNKNIKIGN